MGISRKLLLIIEKEFVPYAESLALKELGFDEPCLAYYYPIDNINFGLRTYINIKHQDRYFTNTPLYQQAFRWFREKYDLHPSFTRYRTSSITRESIIFTHIYEIHIINEIDDITIDVGSFNSHEEAELECLKKLIELCKKN